MVEDVQGVNLVEAQMLMILAVNQMLLQFIIVMLLFWVNLVD